MKQSPISSFEKNFDRFAAASTRLLGSSISFLIAVAVIIYWVSLPEFLKQNRQEMIRDGLLAITFLNFFLVQKSVNRYSAALHLKVNELVASHDQASNEVVNVEEKTEEEIRDLAKQYEQLGKEPDESRTKKT